MTTEHKEKIQQMRQEGQSYSQISATLGISENTIKSYCRRNKLAAFKDSDSNSITLKADSEIRTVCKQCGKVLEQGIKGQPKKFCSEECRRAWWKSNDSQIIKKAWYILTCAGCGKTFESYGNKNRKFCGHACYIKNRFKKERDFHDSRAV